MQYNKFETIFPKKDYTYKFINKARLGSFGTFVDFGVAFFNLFLSDFNAYDVCQADGCTHLAEFIFFDFAKPKKSTAISGYVYNCYRFTLKV